MNKKIVVLGAGISGLATAFWLIKDGFDVTVLEAEKTPGGSMRSAVKDGFLIDYGPNSGLETTPLIRQIVDEVGLSNEMIYANETSSKRYILKDDRLHALPMNPGLFLSTKLFSAKAKLRLLKEPFIGRSEDGYYQSIADFVKRRLGQEFLDYAIDPFVSGVFAGDPDKLSVKSAFPKLFRLEELYGGLIKGMIKGAGERKSRNEESKQSAKMFSFVNGMQSFPAAIANKITDKIIYDCRVKSVERQDGKWNILYENNGVQKNIMSDLVISSVPAYTASKIFGNLDHDLSQHLNAVYYPPVMVLFLGFKKDSIGIPLDGFGFLIPSKENKTYLGAIWSSTIFPNRCNSDMAAFTLFIGGARSPHLFQIEKSKLIDSVLSEFKQIMNARKDPILIEEKMWDKAIPQYNLGYIEHENYFADFEEKNPGIILGGNYRGGISVGDCIKSSGLIAEKLIISNK